MTNEQKFARDLADRQVAAALAVPLIQRELTNPGLTWDRAASARLAVATFYALLQEVRTV